jgi:hypothetical protein
MLELDCFALELETELLETVLELELFLLELETELLETLLELDCFALELDSSALSFTHLKNLLSLVQR